MKPPMRFAFHLKPDGTVDYIGEVVAEEDGAVTLSILDAVMATGCGVWMLADEQRSVPAGECIRFRERRACLETALQLNNALYRRKGAELPA